ncbi:C-type lectin domain family 6 member A-like [Oenanthe melanoleuca]|uniref:C-type lectin domain family 6 member A-like n=1 Tax=Oenanthe melanoleuca TaxID=2939378 RepID=UPI0024C170FE|nr:C-type lectin domain family 6 member A-like [Oenanthe melanoleuca]
MGFKSQCDSHILSGKVLCQSAHNCQSQGTDWSRRGQENYGYARLLEDVWILLKPARPAGSVWSQGKPCFHKGDVFLKLHFLGGCTAEVRSFSSLNIWVFLMFALAIKAAFVTICLVFLFWHSSDQPRALQQQFSEWKCDSAEPQGTDRGWMCCPEGWRRFQRSCYFLSLDTMNCAESEQNCTGMGSQLVVINSKAEQEFLSEQIKQSPPRQNFYIGLIEEKEGEWHWVDKTPYDVTAA